MLWKQHERCAERQGVCREEYVVLEEVKECARGSKNLESIGSEVSATSISIHAENQRAVLINSKIKNAFQNILLCFGVVENLWPECVYADCNTNL